MNMVSRILDARNHFPDTKLVCGKFITDTGMCPLGMVALHEGRIDKSGLYFIQKSPNPELDIATLLGVPREYIEKFIGTWDGLRGEHVPHTECGTCDALYLLRYFEKEVL